MLEQYQDIVSIHDLCEILNIGKNAAYRLLNHQEIESFRVGNRWKIPKTSIVDYITKAVKHQA